MNKVSNKYEFLAIMLENRHLSTQQKERILRLAEKDFTDDETLVRIKKIEDSIQDSKTSSSSYLPGKRGSLENDIANDTSPSTKEKGNVTKEKKHNPRVMVKFLHKFSMDEHFKWFTHRFDTNVEFDYASYLTRVRKELPKNTSTELSPINYYTYSNVRNFLGIGKDREGKFYPCKVNNSENLPYCWSSPEVQEWCEQNPGCHPFEARINREPFSTYINQFKNNIEFRADFPDETFYRSCKALVRKHLTSDFVKTFTRSFDTLAPAMNVYIDRNQFFSGLRTILDWIQQYKAKSTQVEFSLEELPSYYLFEITHLGSFFSLAKNSPKLLGIQGDFDKVRKAFFSIVDWEIKAPLKDQKRVSIICLDENTVAIFKQNEKEITLPKNVIQEIDEELAGVQYRIKLYKTL